MQWTRKEAVAGRFYPNDPQKLSDNLQKYCGPPPSASDAPRRVPWAIVAPHAGYQYSGRIAGAVYGRSTISDRVILLCPNHTGRGSRISVWSEGEWSTPLGPVKVNREIANDFLDLLPEADRDREAHLYEHAIEVHLPFLRWLNPSVEIVPIALGPLSLAACLKVGEALANTLERAKQRHSPGAQVVASTDMSHYIPAETARELDEWALREVEKISPEGLYRTVAEKDISMCGFIPTTVTLQAARSAGIKHAEILSYGNSGEVSGDLKSVVGYAAGWLY